MLTVNAVLRHQYASAGIILHPAIRALKTVEAGVSVLTTTAQIVLLFVRLEPHSFIIHSLSDVLCQRYKEVDTQIKLLIQQSNKKTLKS